MEEFNDSTQFVNNTNNVNGIQCTGSWPSTTVQLISYLSIFVFTLAGNLLIVAVFYRDKTLRTTVNYFIVNMCVSDVLLPTINIPIWIIFDQAKNETMIVVEYSFSVLCKIFWISFGVSLLVSLFSMTALAADRFRAIIFPMKPSLFSKKKCYAAIAVMWISSFAFLVYYAIDTSSLNPSSSSCIESQTEFISKNLKFFLVFFALVCSSVAVVTIFYSRVAIFLYRQKNSLHLASELVKKRAKRNRKIITMLIIIVILFYVVWIPYYVMMVLYLFFHVFSLPCFYMWFSAFVLPIIYPVINPVVYFVFNKKYRQGLKRILCCL